MSIDRAPWDRSGLATTTDLASPSGREALSLLEREQSEFLSKEAEFRSADYRWPRDALHNWSRVWEYPYVFHHLLKFQATRDSADGRPRVLDFGSGSTFFPFTLARRGWDVLCVDIDPVAGRDIARATAAHQANGVSFDLTNGSTIVQPDRSVDAAYSVSVLEHIPDPTIAVAEIARVLKPGGLFVLTIDVAMEGAAAEIQPPGFHRLLATLATHFDYRFPETSVHPMEILRSDRGPYRLRSPGELRDLARRTRNSLLKELFGQERGIVLACHGFCLVRKE